MRKFRVLLDGEVLREEYECMGSYDVANELFPSKKYPRITMANIAAVSHVPGRFECVLLDHGNKHLVAEAK